MKVRIKESLLVKDTYGNGKIINFAGFTGELQSDGTVIFDEESKKKLPKGWIEEGEREGFNPYGYVVCEENLEYL